MEQQKKPQVSLEQAEEGLRAAKDRLSGQAENLSIKEYMVKHPYIALGAAFFTGTLLGGSGEVRESIIKAVVAAVSNEVVHHDKKER